jgi:hypothetical protein
VLPSEPDLYELDPYRESVQIRDGLVQKKELLPKQLTDLLISSEPIKTSKKQEPPEERQSMPRRQYKQPKQNLKVETQNKRNGQSFERTPDFISRATSSMKSLSS